MPVIDADTIRESITIKDQLFVPEMITKAIGETTISDVKDISKEISRLVRLYKKYVTYDGPTPIDYSNDLTIDAYAINYLPRSTIIPKLLFLSLAYHPAFRNIKDEVNILDLGSGTGGVVLGLLDMFNSKPYSGIKANILSCERSSLALGRQKDLINHDKYHHCSIWHSCFDLSDAEIYTKGLSKLAPYDYIIAANLFAELSLKDIELVLSRLPSIMAPNGVLLIADPPRTYIDRLKISISKTLRNSGLSQYYPCPVDYNCQKTKCQWVWLNYDFECPNIEVSGETLETTKRLATTWSIYCKSEHSIYDVLYESNADLTWGVAVPLGHELGPKETLSYIVCTPDGPREIKHTRKEAMFRDETEVILRGSVIGYDDDLSPISFWHPLYGLQ